MAATGKKICFVTGNFLPQVGGLAKSAHRVVSFLCEAGFEVQVVVPVEGMNADDAVSTTVSNCALIHWVPIKGTLLNSNGQILNRYINALNEEQHFDVFHAYFFSLAYTCLNVSVHSERPLIASIRGSDAYIWSAPNMQRLCGSILKKITCLTTVNSHLATLITQNAHPGKVALIRNSIPVNTGLSWELTRCKKGLIGTSGSFRPCKDIPSLLHAICALENNENLLLIGDFVDEGNRSACDAIIKEAGIREKVSLTGFISNEEVLKKLLGLHVFVMTSTTEGFPNSLLEAASLGVPIVTTAFKGIEDYITNEVHALIVPVGDTTAIAAAIKKILEDDALAKRLSAGALQLAAQLTSEIEKQAWISVYEEVTNLKNTFVHGSF